MGGANTVFFHSQIVDKAFPPLMRCDTPQEQMESDLLLEWAV